MPLEVGDFGAAQEDVLASLGGGLLLLDLNLHDHRWVLDDLRNVGTVARADFTEDTLVDPDDTADEPVALYSGQTLKFPPLAALLGVRTQKTPIVLYEQ